MNSHVNCALWVIMQSINVGSQFVTNVTTLMGISDNEGEDELGRTSGITLYVLFKFSVNLKLLLKLVCKKSESRRPHCQKRMATHSSIPA